ncbi:hypothetical protein K8I61_07315 [bacterium]|nr:hypothetical protein [bacterium]
MVKPPFRSGAADRTTFRIAFALVLAAHLWLIGSRGLLPYTDLPNHMAIASIVRHHGDANGVLGDAFTVDLAGKPNVAYWYFASRRIFESPARATTYYYLLYVALFAFSLLFAIRRVGGDPWFSLLGFLLLYNFNVTWGFVGYTLALPLTLLLFTTLAGKDRPGALRWLGASALAVPIFFTHAIAFLFAAGLIAAITFARDPKRPRAWVPAALALVPALVFFAPWMLRQPPPDGEMGLREFAAFYYTGPYWASIPKRAGFLVFDNYRLFARPWGYAIAAVFALACFLPAVWTRVTKPEADDGRSSHALLAFAACCFFLLPAWMPGHWAIFQRFSVWFLIGALIFAAARFGGEMPRPARIGAVILTAVHLALWAQYHIAFDRENAGFDAAFFPAPAKGEMLTGVIADDRFRGRPVYNHFPSYFIAWRNGVAATRIVDYRFGAIARRAPGTPPAYVDFLEDENLDDRYERDGIAWLLTRGAPPPSFDVERCYTPVRETGAWRLWQRKTEGGAP